MANATRAGGQLATDSGRRGRKKGPAMGRVPLIRGSVRLYVDSTFRGSRGGPRSRPNGWSRTLVEQLRVQGVGATVHKGKRAARGRLMFACAGGLVGVVRS